ncbi:hypothetical protein BE17_47540 [Sorangium cellulosum]|uniref:Uncharacterized protein n=1 Tax=Sorangium cellulosum TaxID=56 RepID=A0A150SRF1_SORCE|nr:hypothetical protein BE17_47540 [Sorangium cellulosum]
MTAEPRSLGTAALSLRLSTSRGMATYVTYLISPGEGARIVAEIEEEVRALGEDMTIATVGVSSNAARLVHDLPAIVGDVLLVCAENYSEADWRFLDLRRSALTREGAVVFVTTPASFAELMQVAPNLASWLGGLVFSHKDTDALARAQMGTRLNALRVWSGKSDTEVLEEAERGTLPRDPEYAEWLVLLGRGDLLDAS